MNRRDFIAGIAAATVTTSPDARPASPQACGSKEQRSAAPAPDPGDVGFALPSLQREFEDVLAWLETHGWTAFLKRVAGLDLAPGNPGILSELVKRLDNKRLRSEHGLEDFAGVRAIEPGDPAMSLLYHVLASPRVKLKQSDIEPTAEHYPSFATLDTVENYIYARARLDDAKLADDSLVLAVFAYEYRPAGRTPHRAHADLVYSRTGIARIGTRGPRFDPEHRRYIPAPEDPRSAQDVAATPARYALFLAKTVCIRDASRIGSARGDRRRTFLLPFRKLSAGDLLLGDARLSFSESHRSEKLRRLVKPGGMELPSGEFDVDQPPFIRTSCSIAETDRPVKTERHDCDLVELERVGSSVLVSSVPGDLVRDAVQRGKRVRFKVPPTETKFFGQITAVQNSRRPMGVPAI